MNHWKPIKGYEGIYEMNLYGEVMICRTGKLLTPCSVTHSKSEKEKRKSSNTYLRVRLSKDGVIKYFRIHRLVAEAFIENHNPGEYNIVNHKDGNTFNNKVHNLEWCSVSQNTWHYHNILKVKSV